VQISEAIKLREKWGDKPCDHKSLDKEYHLGSATGDFVCIQCGCSGWGEDWPKKEAKNNKATIEIR